MDLTLTNTTCFHCGEACKAEATSLGDKQFCCNGCKSVYEILHQNELDDYYCLNQAPGTSRKKVDTQKFGFLDDPAITAKLLSFANAEISRVTFHLPQMHCSSCLWLLENLHKINAGIVTSQVNFSRKELSLTYNNDAFSLRAVAEMLASIGYEPHLSLQDLENGTGKKINSKQAVYKLGIAGFCFANIMLLSFPEYLGLTPENDLLLTRMFRILNVALSIPIFFYCAREFFVNAFYSYKQRYLNIDTPIALAIFVTFARSLYEVFTGTGGGYFDSMSGIVFFMLVGRAVQNKVHSTLQFNRDYKSYFPIAVTVSKEGKEGVKMIKDVVENDVIVLHHNEIVPVDSFYSKGNALLDYSFITGESAPVVVNKGELVYAGGRVIDGGAEMLAIKPFSQNSFTQLWNNPAFAKEESEKNAGFTRLSKYFSLVVMAVAAAAFLYWYPKNSGTAWNALTAVLIVACPCALLLTASFTYGYLIELFAQKGFFVKNALTIDNLSRLDTIVFDKTGTLTEVNSLKAQPVLLHWNAAERDIALSVLNLSHHPISKAVVKQEGSFGKQPIEHFKETPGMGIEAWVGERYLKAGKAEFVLGRKTDNPAVGGSELYIMADDKLLAFYSVESTLRKGVGSMFAGLNNYHMVLLSGDNESARSQMEAIFPAGAQLVFNQTPANKLDLVARLQKQGKTVLMVGDGLNDAGALRQADAGVAILENSFSFTPGCDGVLEARNMQLLPKYLKAATQSRTLIYIGLFYSVIYNLLGIYFSVTGQMQPVIAAVLMPLSSLGVILLTYTGSRYIFKKSQFQ